MPEKITEMVSNAQFKNDYTRYGIYILYRRVLSDYRDGLKPVQRRILWAMYKNTKAITTQVKSAAVVGDVMKLYHPHGDCLRGDTVFWTLQNNFITIQEAYEKGIPYLDILTLDQATGNVIPARATNFRIGQYANKLYHIVLSNGTEVVCTANHPFMTSDGQWVKAENLQPYMSLMSKLIEGKLDDKSYRPNMDGSRLHTIVHDFYYGAPPKGYDRHHKDMNPWNNGPENLVGIPTIDHINFHKGSDTAIKGLDNGRHMMFETEGVIRDRTRAKNSILASEFNKDQGFRRFHHVINMMKEQGMEITEENYESFRGKVYNLPIVSRLIERHPELGSSFDELVVNKPVPLNKLFDARASELDAYKKNEYIKPIDFYSHNKFQIFKTFTHMIEKGIPLTPENYFKYRKQSVNDTERIDSLIRLYSIQRPYIMNVYVEDVDSTPMYDFTVEGTENAFIPVMSRINAELEPMLGFNMPLICIHNSSIYGTMKPMANWFETYIPLIHPEGNWGTFQGDPIAASRYTECKLSKFAIENVLGDIIESPEAVDWSPTYSGATKEPDYLPVKVPLLLINGSFGIGLGMRAEIPTHNLSEVIDATLALMDNPEAEITLVPDHSLECEIFDTDFTKICRAGFGHYRIRGRVDIEEYKKKKALVIKSVPNMTFLNSVTEKIEDLIKKKKIIQIDDCFDESTVDKMRYVIVLKNGSDPNYVKEVLYKNTNLEQTLRINFETLNGLNPLRMSYKSYLLSFIDFRKMTKFRVYSNKLQDVQTKIHEREAYIKALESGEIDNIIQIIKGQKKVDDNALIEYLVKKLKITDLQAKYIIEADLKRLSYGYLEKYKSEAAELELIKKELMTHIMDDKVIENDIRQELLDIKAKYGKPRNCKIISADEVSDIPKGEMIVAITEKNFVRKVPANTPIGNFRNDTLRTAIHIDNTDSILIFDEVGKVFKLPVHKIPFTDKNSNGIDIRFIIKSLTANICTIIPESVLKNLADKGHPNNKHYLVTLTNSGLIKRMDLDDFLVVPPSGILYAKLDKGDFMKDIVVAHSNFSLVVYADRKAVIMSVNDTPYLKRNTKGSRSMSGVESVDGICVIHNNCTDIAVITESGKINRISIIQGIPNSGKGKSGSNLIKLASGDSIAGVVSGNESDSIHIKCANGDSIIPFTDLQVGSSISAGQKVLATRGNKILHCYIEPR